MKAKVKDTGEIIDVQQSYTFPELTINEDYWWCEDNKQPYHTNDLEFMEDTPETAKPNINWEQRRYELAKEAMNGILSSPNLIKTTSDYNLTLVVDNSIKLANMLIEELKKY